MNLCFPCFGGHRQAPGPYRWLAWGICLWWCLIVSGCQVPPSPPTVPSNNSASLSHQLPTWKAVSAVGERDLLAVDVLDARTAWAVGDITTETGTLWKTTDGGTTWAAAAKNTEVLAAVSFLDHHTGWVAGYAGRIEKTTDGGQTWTRQRFEHEGENLNALCFSDPQTGWAVGGVAGKSLLLHTVNGGETWEQAPLNRHENLWNIKFATPQSGWIVGEDGLIMGTQDSGKTWMIQRSGTGVPLHGLACLSPQTAVAVGAKGEILRTEDGVHWNSVPAPGKAALHSVAAFSPAGFWAGGANGTLLGSTDGGKTWQTSQSPSNQTLYALDVQSLEAGIAVGRQGLMLRLGPNGSPTP